jgi:hypothetical protein
MEKEGGERRREKEGARERAHACAVAYRCSYLMLIADSLAVGESFWGLVWRGGGGR